MYLISLLNFKIFQLYYIHTSFLYLYIVLNNLGDRFGYTYYEEDKGAIWESIEYLDRKVGYPLIIIFKYIMKQ